MCTRKDVQRAALAFGKEHEHGCETMDVAESQVPYPRHVPAPVQFCSSGVRAAAAAAGRLSRRGARR